MLTALAVAFIAADIRSTPESAVLKWAFVLIVAYTGPVGAFLYVLGCREPVPGLHERYVSTRWRQTLGSAMHCVAGDGVGILVGAVIGSAMGLSAPVHVALEYVLGFGFGWTMFQALFMRGTSGGSFGQALRRTFIPEFLSMNALMAGMVPVTAILMGNIPGSGSPLGARFWFVMSMALLSGGIVAYPMNWWLVGRRLKHGMMTVRRADASPPHVPQAIPPLGHGATSHAGAAGPSRKAIAAMATLSVAIFAFGIALAARFGSLK